MATSSGIWSHAAASISLAKANPAAINPVSAASSSPTSPSTSSGATISANDFLTLLVTEMQNQDPTATTDPNEYINQLVNVNSLEQLIQINQTLSSAVPAPSSGATPGPSTPTSASNAPSNGVRSVNQASAHAPVDPSDAAHPTSPRARPQALSPSPVAAPVTSGNLAVPDTSPAALRMAQALGARRSF